MASDALVIVFAKNILLGKVKTRLARSIGDLGAFEVYKYLVEITEKATSNLHETDVQVYFSDVVIEDKWKGHPKFVQSEGDLGVRMQTAFQEAFKMGYKKVIGIGCDLPEINENHLNRALKELEMHSTVFGPAEDGGYYLLGMREMIDCVFENKDWSTEILLKQTLEELELKEISTVCIETLNDIDTLDDLKKSSISHKFRHLYELPEGDK